MNAATVEKVTLLGPPPAGGSYTTPLRDDHDRALVDRLIGEGWTVSRRWHVPAAPAEELIGDVRDPELRLAIAATGGVTTFGDAPVGALLTVDFGEGPRWARVTVDERRKVLALGTATEAPELAGDDVVMFRPTNALMVVIVDGPTCTTNE